MRRRPPSTWICASSGSCAAVGDYTDDSGNEFGLVLNETGGEWSNGVAAALPADATTEGQEAALYSVSCAAAGSCSAVGRYFDKSNNTQALLLTERAGSWKIGEEASLPSNVNKFGSYSAYLLSVSSHQAGRAPEAWGEGQPRRQQGPVER